MTALGSRAGAGAIGLIAGRWLGEPGDRVHPVAGFGRVMSGVERAVWGDSRARGGVYAAVGLVLGGVAGLVCPSVSVAVTVTTAGPDLRRTAESVGRAVTTGNLGAARAALPSLVGRDPAVLDGSGIAAAAIESVGENTVDAVVAPTLWAVVAGAPGAFAYRAVNTMDAMVGHRSARYRRFGTVAARLDDAANYLPARVTALAVAALRPGRAQEILRVARRDGAGHPSPNAGLVEAAFGAALRRRLGGPLQYDGRLENRPQLGYGPRPAADDVAAAVRLADQVERLLIVVLAVIWLLDRPWRRT